jgi:glutamate synthase (ferredoxin)
VPDQVVNFFVFVAEEVRQILAQLGYRSLGDIIGRADLLQPRQVTLRKTQGFDPTVLTQLPDTRTRRDWLHHEPVHSNGPVLDDQLLQRPEVQQAIATQTTATVQVAVRNTDRSVGARIAGEIARRYGDDGFQGHITLYAKGSAGQSFGAFNLPGMTLHLTGEANDYVGKGMAGGVIVLAPDAQTRFAWHENVIAGNTLLYGATGGELYAAGQVGERFAVRNSGAIAVVEGVGDHGCEYMTGGAVVILGPTGRNFGAGMTGGVAYVLDETRSFERRYNPQLIELRPMSARDEARVQQLIRRHVELTGSPRGADILARWENYRNLFWTVMPREAVARIENAAEGTEELKPAAARAA